MTKQTHPDKRGAQPGDPPKGWSRVKIVNDVDCLNDVPIKHGTSLIILWHDGVTSIEQVFIDVKQTGSQAYAWVKHHGSPAKVFLAGMIVKEKVKKKNK